MGCSGITQFVHTLDDCVEGRVVADGGIGAVKVIVNGARQSDYGEVVLSGQSLGAGKGTVASDDYQSVNSEFFKVVIGLFPSFRSLEILAPGCLEKCAAPLDRVADTLCRKFLEFTMNKTFIASVNAHDLHAVENGASGHRADTCVHSRRVTT